MLSTRLLLLVAVITVGATSGTSQIEDNLSVQEKTAVADVRERLKGELSESYMLEDYWLAKWSRVNEFNVEKTSSSLKKYLQLRKDQNLNGILNEDWSEMRARFPYSRKTTDKSGKPVLYADAAEWDIASFLTTKEASDQLTRYCIMLNEESEAHVRQLRAKGKNVSQYTFIVNAGGFSSSKHECAECVSFYRNGAAMIEDYVIANAEKTVVINVPHRFKTVHSLFSDKSRKLIQLFGQDQNEVENMLLGYIDRDQLPNGILSGVKVKDNTEGSMNWNTEL